MGRCLGNEKQMSSFFENNYPSISYLALRWPKSKYLVERYVMSNRLEPDLFKLCNSCLKSLNFYKKNPLLLKLKKLSKICSKNFVFNTYHSPHHFKSVILLSSIFSSKYSLNDFDKILVVILSLTHDMSHQGRRISSFPYYQELKTLKQLEQNIFCKILSFNKWKRIKRIILNTYFPVKCKVGKDLVEKIILDVDVIISLMFGSQNGLKLTNRLKTEIRFNNKSEVLFSDFLKCIEKKKLHLEISKKSCSNRVY